MREYRHGAEQRDVRHSKHCQRLNYLEVQKEDDYQCYSGPSLVLRVSQNYSRKVTADLCNELLLCWMALQGLHEAQDHMFPWCLGYTWTAKGQGNTTMTVLLVLPEPSELALAVLEACPSTKWRCGRSIG